MELTGVCGVIGGNQSQVESRVARMLTAMAKRGTRSHSFFSHEAYAHVGIGYCDWPQASSRQALEVHHRTTLAFDGFLYDSDSPVTPITSGGFSGSLERLPDVPGAFSFVAILDGELRGGRDRVGQKPLYVGSDSDGKTALASLRSALAEIGLSDIRPVSPGTVVRVSTIEKASSSTGRGLVQPPEISVSEGEAVAVVGDLLQEAVSRGVPTGSGLAFSGGLDSGLVAASCKRRAIAPELISVGLRGQPELDHAHKVAVDMGLPITIRELSESEILSVLSEVVATIESTDPVVVAVSIPFFFACEKAREMGLGTIIAGQMSDELFGGYSRFEDLAEEGETDRLKSEIMDSVLAAPTNDFEPGDKLAVSFGLEMRCPFAYLPLAEYALRLPPSMKVKVSPTGTVRKSILRKLASKWKLPEIVEKRPKRAVQYSSGVQRTLEREARRRNTSIRGMLESL